MTTPNPTPGFAPATVGSTQWDAQVQEANARALQDAAAYRAQDPGQTGFLPDFIEKPVEWVGSKLHQVYSDVVARPISTALIATQLGAAEAQNNSQAWGNLFNGNIWDEAYKDSAHVSPGQALTFGLENFFTASNEDLKNKLQAPVMAPIKNELGVPTGERINLNKSGYLWDNPNAVVEKFDSGAEKWISGGLDAGYTWYLDPLAKTGEALGALRQLTYVRPGTYTPDKTFASMALGVISGGKLGGAPVTVDNITKNLQSSAFTQMGDFIMKQKDKLGTGATGGTFENWVANQAWAKNSADTGAIAAQLGKATDRSEVDQILGVAMGAQGEFTTSIGGVVPGLQQLTAKNAELGAMVTQLENQKNGLISGFPANPTPAQALTQQTQLAQISQDLENIARQVPDIQQKIDIAGSMKNGMYFNPLLSPVASNFGDWASKLNTIQQKGVIPNGMVLAYNNLFVRPMRVLTGVTWSAIRAPGHIDIFADNANQAINAALDQAKVWTGDQRARMVSKFLAADPGQKGILLDVMDRATTGKIAQKYGLTDDQASALYSTLTGNKLSAMQGRVYSTANITLPNGTVLRADHIDDGGNVVAVHPILQTQLQNTHIFTDYEKLNSVLKYSAGAFKKILNDQEVQARAQALGPLTLSQMQNLTSDAAKQAGLGLGAKAWQAKQFTGELGNTFNKMWKFTTLLRLNHGVRSVADDFMGQYARFGAYTMLMDRAFPGTAAMAYRKMAGLLGSDGAYNQMVESLESGISSTQDNIAQLQDKIDNINSYLPPAMNYVGRGQRGLRQFNQRTTLLQDTQAKLDAAQDTLNQLRIQRNKIGAVRDSLGDRYIITPDGQAFPKPYEGPQGQVFRDLNSSRQTIDNMLGGTANDLWNRWRTAGDWRTLTATTDGAQQHLKAWAQVVQHQLANDDAAQIIVKGGTADDLEKWFNKPDGNQYFQSLGLKNMGKDDLADRIAATVDHLLPTHTPEMMGLRQAVAQGANDRTVIKLMGDTNIIDRPSVQSEGTAYAMGKSDVIKGMDKIMSGFYNRLQNVPAEVLSRNPLFFSLYRQHVNDLWLAAKNQGITHLSPAMQEQIANQGRKLALTDTKRFTYNMDFESKLAYNMRFIAPFWGPMQEAFTRWGRIIADKPEIVAHAADIFTSPIRTGHAVDQNGNPVDSDGYSTDPITGQRTLVAKNDMHIQFQVPSWVIHTVGKDFGPGTKLDMPISTLNLVLQNDPWYNPGMGPWVQIPANYVALKDNAKVGDMLTKLGVLNQVKANSLDQLGMPPVPTLLKTILGGDDPAQQQKDMLQIMQAEDYKWKTGLRETEPTWKEVKDKAETGAMLRAWFKVFNFTGASMNTTDPYQFFRDQYQNLQRANPATADQVFLAKYGDAAFAFSAAMSKSGKGLPATAEAVMADKKFSYLTDQYPELAQLIVGPYSHGDYSKTAYTQQVVNGDRVPLTAAESMKQANVNAGWALYTKYMDTIRAGLYQAGYTSFKDKGAKPFDDQRKALIAALSTAKTPNGQVNPFFNSDWTAAFNTQNKAKDDLQANVLNQLVTEKALIDDPMRSDIRSLATYMVNRNSVQQVLAARKAAGGSNDINSKKNEDLKMQFFNATNGLVEGDTLFQALHDRFLSHDMFNHNDPGLSMAAATSGE